MSCCLKAGRSVYGSNDLAFKNRAKGCFRVCSSIQTLHFRESSNPRECLGKTLHLLDQKPATNLVNASIYLLIYNMIEIESAQELVDSLLNGGERLAVVGFYSPACGGCITLHPKILCIQRLYRGAEGGACSFSCSNATIKKFKDALARHGSGSWSLGSAKGLDESELAALASRGLISRNLVGNDSISKGCGREEEGVFSMRR
ncbi:hypothetical protein SASPL_154973 [Salvia splendens]|uniref:Uncharacterized protein n=1 Tax=Salvia splendens TaxID=180675 RepID=A0A8X8W1J5_SALSN|nr:hypothetical protein SASPL_154973 [Salvia splendens]